MVKKNIFITLSGMDGIGKSTLAEGIANHLKRKHKSVRSYHGHQYTTAQKSLSLGADQVRKFRWLFFLLVPVAYLDNLLTYYKKYRPLIQKNTLISDRYFYDKVVRLVYYGIIPLILARLYVKILPRPDKVFFLDADTQTVYNRKKEYSLKEYKKFRKIYLDIGHTLDAHIVNTDQSYKSTLKQIINNI